jgi:ankyrin repeat protein
LHLQKNHSQKKKKNKKKKKKKKKKLELARVETNAITHSKKKMRTPHQRASTAGTAEEYLHLAACTNDPRRALKALDRRRADVRARDDEGATALYHAAGAGGPGEAWVGRYFAYSDSGGNGGHFGTKYMAFG